MDSSQQPVEPAAEPVASLSVTIGRCGSYNNIKGAQHCSVERKGGTLLSSPETITQINRIRPPPEDKGKRSYKGLRVSLLNGYVWETPPGY